MTDEAWAEAQAALLELLAAEPDPEELRRRVRDDPACEPLAAWIDAARPEMLQVMGELVRQWGVRTGTPAGSARR
ncbi:MAG: hypothetical protein ABMA64_37640 [Myxococcota bacterium]